MRRRQEAERAALRRPWLTVRSAAAAVAAVKSVCLCRRPLLPPCPSAAVAACRCTIPLALPTTSLQQTQILFLISHIVKEAHDCKNDRLSCDAVANCEPSRQ